MKTTASPSTARAPRFLSVFAAWFEAAFPSSGGTTTWTASKGDFPSLANLVRLGDRVDCTLTNGSRVQVNIAAIDQVALVGRERHVRVADIAHLSFQRSDRTKTSTLVRGATVLAGSFALPSVAIAVTPFCFPVARSS